MATYKAAQLHYPNGDADDTSLPSEYLPLLERPLIMEGYGILAFTEVSGKPHAALGMFNYVWDRWRAPTLAELVAPWAARHEPKLMQRSRGWWQPTLSELRLARQRARSVERRRQRSSPMIP